tara:strand:- start:72 stop:287 length:216 start_codon:yes stop_codon:yes gene_type:complete
MKRGGEGVDYIRKTVNKWSVVQALTDLQKHAEVLDSTPGCGEQADGICYAVDTLADVLDLFEGHPTHGWFD